ncbi:sigma factor [Streptomyces sp. DH10]|uniref:sigma factor n=1 Tax=Streptomyces sp. DH10 TaxID=3040121 RepID=UPI002441C608|nr:sigma factor [Streptomyces sp. DH10]MDG9711397.1 sigma factor [Streptomyces sp. DH10]
MSDPFERYRQVMFGISYRMLGTVVDAEDVVQETWLRWQRVDRDAVADPRGYLVRAVTRTAIDQMRRSRVRREEYVGPWLPEPLLVSSDVAVESSLLGESLSMAVLVMMETLSPLERAFRAARGTASASPRSLRRSTAPRRRYASSAAEPRAMCGCATGASSPIAGRPARSPSASSPPASTATWKRSWLCWPPRDVGGRQRPRETPCVPLHSAAATTEYFASTAGRYPAGLEVRMHEQYDGAPAAVLATPAGVSAVVTADIDLADGLPRITAVGAVRNPEKLGRVPAGR